VNRHLIPILALLLPSYLRWEMAVFSEPPGKSLQIKGEALEQVPLEKRARLLERLGRYLDSLRKEEFSNIYQLIPDGCRHGLSKDQWQKQVRYESPGRIEGLIVSEVYQGEYEAPEILQGEKWIVKGCAIYRRGKESTSFQASYSLLLLNAEWYVCRSGILVEGKDNHYVRCSVEASNPPGSADR
jgi:hypothetical protein